MSASGLQNARGMLVDDFRKVAAGFAALVRNRWSEDEVGLCLGFLSSAQEIAARGGPNYYFARLMNPQGLFGTVRLVMDVYELVLDSKQPAHLGFAAAEISLQGKASRDLCWSFDWESEVGLAVDEGESLPVVFEGQDPRDSPSGFWRVTVEVSAQEAPNSQHALSIVERVG